MGGLCPAHCALRTPYTVHRTCTYVSAHSVVRRSVRILVSAVRRARRQEASSRAVLCTAQLRPGDGSDVIGSGPTHTNKLALPTQTFNNTYIKPQTEQGISIARKSSVSTYFVNK